MREREKERKKRAAERKSRAAEESRAAAEAEVSIAAAEAAALATRYRFPVARMYGLLHLLCCLLVSPDFLMLALCQHAWKNHFAKGSFACRRETGASGKVKLSKGEAAAAQKREQMAAAAEARMARLQLLSQQQQLWWRICC